MQTHFVRVKARFHQRLASPLESLVYQATPADRLVLKRDIVMAVVAHCKSHPEDGCFKPKEIDATVSTLAERQFLKEVHGSRLDRFLESF